MASKEAKYEFDFHFSTRRQGVPGETIASQDKAMLSGGFQWSNLSYDKLVAVQDCFLGALDGTVQLGYAAAEQLGFDIKKVREVIRKDRDG